MTLDELITGCKQQHAAAQEALYRKYSDVLFGICLKYSPGYAEAQDNLQDAFITIFSRIEQYEGKGSFEGWIKRITVNTVLQKYRKKRTFDIADESALEDQEDEVAFGPEVPLDYLLRIVQELPYRYRLVFNLYVLDGYSHKEIADMLDISDGTSKSNLARARGILKKKVEEYNKDASG